MDVPPLNPRRQQYRDCCIPMCFDSRGVSLPQCLHERVCFVTLMYLSPHSGVTVPRHDDDEDEDEICGVDKLLYRYDSPFMKATLSRRVKKCYRGLRILVLVFAVLAFEKYGYCLRLCILTNYGKSITFGYRTSE